MASINPQPSLFIKIVAVLLVLGGIVTIIPAVVRLVTGSAPALEQFINLVLAVIAIIVGRGLMKLQRPVFFIALVLLILRTLYSLIGLVGAIAEVREALPATIWTIIISITLLVLLIVGRKDFARKTA